MLQEYSAFSHYAPVVRDYLNERFSNRWIGLGSNIPWPTRSSVLTILDLFVWGSIKSKVKRKNYNFGQFIWIYMKYWDAIEIWKFWWVVQHNEILFMFLKPFLDKLWQCALSTEWCHCHHRRSVLYLQWWWKRCSYGKVSSAWVRGFPRTLPKLLQYYPL